LDWPSCPGRRVRHPTYVELGVRGTANDQGLAPAARLRRLRRGLDWRACARLAAQHGVASGPDQLVCGTSRHGGGHDRPAGAVTQRPAVPRRDRRGPRSSARPGGPVWSAPMSDRLESKLPVPSTSSIVISADPRILRSPGASRRCAIFRPRWVAGRCPPSSCRHAQIAVLGRTACSTTPNTGIPLPTNAHPGSATTTARLSSCTRGEWRALLPGMRDGEFDPSSSPRCEDLSKTCPGPASVGWRRGPQRRVGTGVRRGPGSVRRQLHRDGTSCPFSADMRYPDAVTCGASR